jgi:protein-L-isoaspartate(D-aspartate) O-methyltransferase
LPQKSRALLKNPARLAMTDFAAARRHMVDGQLRTTDVTDLRVLTAMAEVPRERFLPPALASIAYLDMAAPVGAAGRSLLKPMLLAKLVQAADMTAADKVLVVGCATGYGAAVIAHVAGKVVALEQDAALAQSAREALAGEAKISVVSGPLAAGWPAEAPYEVILLEGAAETMPPALLQQLAEGGRLVCVMGAGPGAKATVYRRSGEDFGGRTVFDAAAPLLPGFAKPVEFAF